MRYQRCDYGYVSDDQRVFIERGAPMSDTAARVLADREGARR